MLPHQQPHCIGFVVYILVIAGAPAVGGARIIIIVSCCSAAAAATSARHSHARRMTRRYSFHFVACCMLDTRVSLRYQLPDPLVAAKTTEMTPHIAAASVADHQPPPRLPPGMYVTCATLHPVTGFVCVCVSTSVQPYVTGPPPRSPLRLCRPRRHRPSAAILSLECVPLFLVYRRCVASHGMLRWFTVPNVCVCVCVFVWPCSRARVLTAGRNYVMGR